MLEHCQIERYSRQIIVRGFGGVAQERLLGARLLVAGDGATLALTLAYLAGAGVGTLELHSTGLDPDGVGLLGVRIRELNPEAAIEPVAAPEVGSAPLDGALIMVSDRQSLELADRLIRSRWPGRGVLVWTDQTPGIAVFRSAPPCPLCAKPALLGGFRPRWRSPANPAVNQQISEAGVVTALATTEVLKLLAGIGSETPACVIGFDGYDTRRLGLETASPSRGCTCRQSRYRMGGGLSNRSAEPERG